MVGKTDDEIAKCIKIFLDPDDTKSHGRPIFMKQAKDCGLNIEAIDNDSNLWKLIYELYIRTNYVVTINASKCIESKDYSFLTPPQFPN